VAADLTSDETTSILRAAFEARIRAALNWLPAHEALQLADALCTVQLETLAGLRVLYRALPKVDAAAVEEDWRRGMPAGEIMRKHKISRAAAYKYHPSNTAQGRPKLRAEK